MPQFEVGLTPDSLLDSCIHFCISNLHVICKDNQEAITDMPAGLLHKRFAMWASLNVYEAKLCRGLKDNIALPLNICDRMLSLYTEYRPVDDNFLSLFSESTHTRLRYVDLQYSEVTDTGLSVVLQHPLMELNIIGCIKLTRKALYLINTMCCGLRSLSASDNIFPERSECNSSSISSHEMFLETPHLNKLVIHYLDGRAMLGNGRSYFEMLLSGMQNLTHLELSGCRLATDLSFLLTHKKLLSLKLPIPSYEFNVEKAIDIICKLTSLQHLDISQSNYQDLPPNELPNELLHQIVTSLPDLMYLDISGTNLDGVGHEDIPGLRSRVGKPLEFLGLLETRHNACHRKNIPAKRIAGMANENQIFTAAEFSEKQSYVMFLDRVIDYYTEKYHDCGNSDLALETVLLAMKRHPQDLFIQYAGSRYLLCAITSGGKDCFSVKCKKQIVKATINCMYNMCIHYDHYVMEQHLDNGFEILMNLEIPEDVCLRELYYKFVDVLIADNYLKKAPMMLDVLHLLSNILDQSVDVVEKETIGTDHKFISFMIMFLKRFLRSKYNNEDIDVACEILQKLTNDCSLNSSTFLQEDGMQLFVEFHHRRPDRLPKILGVLDNVAMVGWLRHKLMKEEYLIIFSGLLKGDSEVGYKAARILSYITAQGPKDEVYVSEDNFAKVETNS